MKTTLTLLGATTAVALLLGACGNDGESAVTDSQFGEESDLLDRDGNVSGATDSAGPASVSVFVELPEDETLGGMAIVTLEDVSLADAPSLELGRVELPVSELIEQDAMVDVFLPVPIESATEVNAAVHIDVDVDGELSEGDWMSPEIVPVTSLTGTTVSVSLTEI